MNIQKQTPGQDSQSPNSNWEQNRKDLDSQQDFVLEQLDQLACQVEDVVNIWCKNRESEASAVPTSSHDSKDTPKAA